MHARLRHIVSRGFLESSQASRLKSLSLSVSVVDRTQLHISQRGRIVSLCGVVVYDIEGDVKTAHTQGVYCEDCRRRFEELLC